MIGTGHLSIGPWGAALAAFLAGAAVAWIVQDDVDPRPVSTPESDVVSLPLRPSDPLARPARSEVRIARASSIAPAPAPTVDTDTAASVLARIQAQGQRSRDHLVSTFAAEPPAADAARLQAVVLRAITDPALADLPVLPASTSVQCRQRLCLLTARFAPGIEPDDWSMRVAMVLAPTFSQSRAVSEPAPNGETVALLYLIRPGPEGTRLAREL